MLSFITLSEITLFNHTIAKIMIPELLAPAGSMEKLKVAVHYGADAVYLGGQAFGLRNLAGNFTLEEQSEALDYCHRRGVKVYLTVNSLPRNSSLEALEEYLHRVTSLPFDALIVADPGVLSLARRVAPEICLHLSTQANTVNRESARFWSGQGISRINLAREMTLEDIRETTDSLPGTEFEVFVHGALCISHSGRCLISSMLTGRDANQGECTHPCRWSYRLVEESRPGEYFPVMEDEEGTFIFNSRDLCLLEHLPALVESGVSSLKIEGRMKGINYVASVLRVYRQALDEYRDNPSAWRFRPEWMEELSKLSHRGYTTGFLFGQPHNVGQEYDSAYIRSHEFVGVVESIQPDGRAVVGVRNRICSGDQLELIGPAMTSSCLQPESFTLLDNDNLESTVDTVHPNQRMLLRLPDSAAPFDLLRREKQHNC